MQVPPINLYTSVVDLIYFRRLVESPLESHMQPHAEGNPPPPSIECSFALFSKLPSQKECSYMIKSCSTYLKLTWHLYLHLPAITTGVYVKVVAIAISLGCECGLYNLRIVSKSSGNRIIGEQGMGIIVKGCV